MAQPRSPVLPIAPVPPIFTVPNGNTGSWLRDLKPENVFLLEQDGKKDNVKIVDFGIAKATNDAPMVRSRNSQENLRQVSDQRISSQTMPGTLMGTPAYLAPEMALGHEVDFRVDQYSLGVILFEMATGQLPFDATTIGQMLQHHISTRPPALSKKANGSTPSLDAIVGRLLAKTPAERFPTMRAVADALEKEIELRLLARGDSSLPAHIAEALNRTQQGTHIRVAGKKVPVWVLLPLLLVFLIGGGALSLLMWRQRSEPPALTREELAELRGKALNVVLTHAKGDNATLRASSANAIGLTREASLRPALETLLKDAEPAVQIHAALALGTLGERQAIGALKAALAGPPMVRLAAAIALARFSDDEGHGILVGALKSKEPLLAKQAALYLCDLGDETARETLSALHNRGAIKNEEDFVALGCLVRLGDESARLELQAKKEASPDRRQKLEAMFWLSTLGDEPTKTELRKLAEKRSPEQLLTAHRLAGPDEPQLVSVFRPVLVNEFGIPVARQLAADGFGKSGDVPHVRELGPLLDEKTVAEVRHEAATAILRLASGDPGLLTTASLSWARAGVHSGSTKQRLLALQILGDLPSSEAVPMLATALTDSSTEIRQAAATSLGHRNERTAMTLLLESASDRDEKVRAASLRALMELAERLSKRDSAGLLQAGEGVLKEITERGTPLERALAAAVLLRLGDKKQIAILKALRTERNPDVRHLLLDALSNDSDFVVLFLADPVDSIRQHAAQILGNAMDKRAIPVLQAFLAAGGVDGLWASGVLRKLGVKEALPADVARLLHSHSIEERVAAVQVLKDADLPFALPLLHIAAQDSSPAVRRAVAEVASKLPKGPHGLAGIPLLRQLSVDPDPTVWTLARSMLARLRTPPDAPIVEPTLPPRRLAYTPDTQKTGPGEAETHTTVPMGKLVLSAPESVYFQVGKRAWQQTPAAIDLPVGKHTVSTLSDEKEVAISPDGEPLKLELAPSPSEKFLRVGLAAAKNGDGKKAISNLDRARALCQKDKKHSHESPCHSIAFDALYYQGRMHENAKDLHLAMETYQKAIDQGEKVKGRSDLKNQLTETMGRYRGRVGQVIVKSLVNGRCKNQVFWMVPGKHQVRDGLGKSVWVDLRGGDQREVGSCDGDK